MGILLTKLHIPPERPGLVPRPQLIRHLDSGLQNGLVLVVAPAGYGKTTLVGRWVRQTKLPVAWVSVDEGDNDLARFLEHVTAALQRLGSGLGLGAEALLASSQLPPTEAVLTSLINDLAGVALECVLVFDDYHLIDAPVVHEVANFFVAHAPSTVHLVISTRTDPPLPLARLRARHRLTEVGADNLKFSSEETAALLNSVMALDLPPNAVGMLERRTEGWVTGLQLAALSLQSQTGNAATELIANLKGGNRYLFDYLASEVLNRQPPATQTFLLETSILSRLSGSLCDALTEKGGSRELLETLEASHLFVVSLDQERRWYRYHVLFGDFLRVGLERSRTDVRALHRRAARWLEHNGAEGEAVHHALAAQDFETAARLIEREAKSLVRHGKLATLLHWFELLPETAFTARPWLGIYRAWVLLLTGRVGEMKALNDEVARFVENGGAADVQGDAAALRGNLLALRGFLERTQGDNRKAAALYQQALNQLPQDAFLQAVISINLGEVLCLTGDTSAAKEVLVKAAEAGQRAGLIGEALVATYFRVYLHLLEGHLTQADALAHHAFALAVESGWLGTPAAGYIHLALADILREQNALDDALQHARQGVECGERAKHRYLIVVGHILLARILQARGDLERSARAMARAVAEERGYDATYYHLPTLAAAHQAQLWLRQGRIAGAWSWSEAKRFDEKEVSHLNVFEHLTFVRVLRAQSSALTKPSLIEVASKHLAKVREAVQTNGLGVAKIEVLVLAALLLHDQGQLSDAKQTLLQALLKAVPEGYIRLFVDYGPPAEKLLAGLLDPSRRASAREELGPDLRVYLRRLLGAFNEDIRKTRQPRPQKQRSESAFSLALNDRERQVLRLIAGGMSNREIGEQLGVTLHTVKWHAGNLYEKLGVRNRSEAVARAKEAGVF